MIRFLCELIARCFLFFVGMWLFSWFGMNLGEYSTPIFLILASMVIFNLTDRKHWSLGLKHDALIFDLLKGIFSGSISIAFVFTIVYLIGGHKIVGIIFDKGALYEWTLFCVLGALGEEIFVRGYLYGFIKHHFGVATSYIVSSGLFASFHFIRLGINVYSISTLFLAGFLYAYMREKTGAIWLSFGFHFAWNFISGVLGIWRDKTILFKTVFAQDPLINGGVYGIEGSVITVSFFLLLVIVLFIKDQKRSNISFQLN
ncbi:CPBP family intramembrane glutamic endopeptidase [Brevibacillus ginsengisoli]|uniref:CPBP family intramembrane glutamic endopeptidase n=1 Tax=Brevibacillus ginsengisoli TaxID=363854 RepID=UPI003CEE1710